MTTKTSTKHLNELWDRSEAASAGAAVQQMLDSPGWDYFQEAIAERLRYEQKLLTIDSRAIGDDGFNRIIGKWTGLRSFEGIAAGIVANGKAVEAAMEAR